LARIVTGERIAGHGSVLPDRKMITVSDTKMMRTYRALSNIHVRQGQCRSGLGAFYFKASTGYGRSGGL